MSNFVALHIKNAVHGLSLLFGDVTLCVMQTVAGTEES